MRRFEILTVLVVVAVFIGFWLPSDAPEPVSETSGPGSATTSSPTPYPEPPMASLVTDSMEELRLDFEDGDGMNGWDELAKLDSVPTGSVEVIKRGRHLFIVNCSVCHGSDARGDGEAGRGLNPPPRDLLNSGEYKYGHKTLALFRTIKYGSEGTGMAPWEGRMTDQEIWAVAFYVRGIQR